MVLYRFDEDQWCEGTNVSTGETGFFPLAALVSDNTYAKNIPSRTDSLHASIGPSSTVDVEAQNDYTKE